MNHFTKRYVIAALSSVEEKDFRKFLKILADGDEDLEFNMNNCIPEEPKHKKRKVSVRHLESDFLYEAPASISKDLDTEEEISRIVLRSPGFGGKARTIKFNDEFIAYKVACLYKQHWERLPYARVEYYPASLIGFLHKEFSLDRPPSNLVKDKDLDICNCPCKRCYNRRYMHEPTCFNHENINLNDLKKN